jgi:gliding motility-associated-like protein
MRILKISILLFFGITQTVFSQRIIRQSLSSTGGSLSNINTYNHYTVGTNCVGCGVITGPNGVIRQGFEQPVGGNVRGCNFAMSFDIKQGPANPCGRSYEVDYSGDQPANATFTWDFGPDATPSIFVGSTPPDIDFGTDGLKNISLTIKSGACTRTVAKVIIAEKSFSIGFASKNINCEKEKGQITLNPVNGVAPFTYSWSNNLGSSDRVSGLDAGIYTVTVSGTNGCTKNQTIEIKQVPKDFLSWTPIITNESCENTQDGEIRLNISGGVKPYNVSWSNNRNGEILDNISKGSYTAIIKDSLGCELTSLSPFVIKEFCNDKSGIPNLVTPNGDNSNDTWEVLGLNKFPNNELEIFNRWGDKVFDAKPYTNNWKGTNKNGEELLTGPYYYLLKLNDPKNTVFSGSVTVLR